MSSSKDLYSSDKAQKTENDKTHEGKTNLGIIFIPLPIKVHKVCIIILDEINVCTYKSNL